MRPLTRSRLLVPAGLALFVLALILPSGGELQSSWGHSVLRVALVVEGILLLWVGLCRRRSLAVPLLMPARPLGEECAHSAAWLAAITVLAAALRFAQAGSDLWLDEITTVIDSQGTSYQDLVTTFTFAGRHLLNSLSVKATMAAVGATEWAIRLPAILLGIAGVPAMYGLARCAFRSREALFAALLLATSYHHVFFSQNARGYTGLLLFSMLGTRCFLRALSRGRTVDWLAYVATMWLAGACMILAVFVVAGHGLVFLGVCWQGWRRHQPLAGAMRAATGAWLMLALLWVQLYAMVLPQMYSYAGRTYKSEALGFAPLSWEHLQEWLRGGAVGFGAGTLIGGLAAGTLAVLGTQWLLRRRPIFALALLAPLPVLAVYQLAAGLRISPRFFIWALPVACLFLVATVSWSGEWLSRVSAGRGAVAARLAAVAPLVLLSLMVGASAVSLWSDRGTPKQPNRESLDWLVAHREPGEPVAAAHLARWGLTFYAPRVELKAGVDFVLVASSEELEAIEGLRPVWVVSTFHRALRIEHPDLLRRLERHYEMLREFPATVGDAEVRVWRQRVSPPGETG